MTGAPHHRRGANNSGYIRTVRLTTGEVRYHARLRNQWLGAFETRSAAQKAIERKRVELGLVTVALPGGGDAA